MNEKLRRIMVRQSETREKLNALVGKDELSDTERADLTAQQTAMRAIETELREALVERDESDDGDDDAGGAPEDAECRERRELREKVTIGGYLRACLLGRQPTGAEDEYAAAMGCPGMVPLTMLGQTLEERQSAHGAMLETRAGETPAPADASLPHTHAPIVPALFDRSVAGALGIEMPTVGTGIQSYPVLSANLTGGIVAEDADAAQTAGSYTVSDADPRRLTGSFKIRKEDIAKLPNLEGSLRENLSQVLSDQFDIQALTGDNAGSNLNGLMRQLTDADDPAAGVETFDRLLTIMTAQVDGLFAVDETGVRGLVGVDTYRLMARALRAGNAADQTFTQYWNQHGGGLRASRRIPAKAAHIQQGIIRKSNPAGDRVAVAPVWMGLELIRDQYGTNAAKGQITVTGVALVGGVVVLRAGAFAQARFRVSV